MSRRKSGFVDAQRTYTAWAHDNGMEPITVLARPDKLDSSAAEAAAATLDHAPDAVYVPPQWLASGLLRAAKNRSIGVPDDLLVTVGVDSQLARTSEPPLTAVDLDPVRTAREAVDLLVQRIDGRTPGAARLIPATLRPRLSSTRAASEHATAARR